MSAPCWGNEEGNGVTGPVFIFAFDFVASNSKATKIQVVCTSNLRWFVPLSSLPTNTNARKTSWSTRICASSRALHVLLPLPHDTRSDLRLYDVCMM